MKSYTTKHLRQVWRVELAPSYSGPVVSCERVFTTETRDKKLEVAWIKAVRLPQAR